MSHVVLSIFSWFTKAGWMQWQNLDRSVYTILEGMLVRYLGPGLVFLTLEALYKLRVSLVLPSSIVLDYL